MHRHNSSNSNYIPAHRRNDTLLAYPGVLQVLQDLLHSLHTHVDPMSQGEVPTPDLVLDSLCQYWVSTCSG
eukprot:9761146-Prorocentrum_lima.AAC.1